MSEVVQALQEELAALRAECARLRAEQAQMQREREESTTEQRRAEMAIRSGEEQFHLLTELIPDTVVIHEDGTLLYTNAAGLKLFGADTLQKVVGKSVLDFVDPTFHQEVVEGLQRARDGGEAHPVPAYRQVQRMDGAV